MAPRKTTVNAHSQQPRKPARKALPVKKTAAKKATPRKASGTEWETFSDTDGETPTGTVETEPDQQWERIDIPRHPRWKGPLVIPPGHDLTPGTRKCKGSKGNGWAQCGRTWATACPCVYYKRTTNFIDVLQDEYKLKEWDRRMVATGMAENAELVLSALAIRPDRDIKQTPEDKKKLQEIADKAKDYAKGGAAASIGTSLHTLTQWMDEGKELGYVPEPYPADLEAYRLCTKEIEWTNIESFRVYDDWKVGGTTDRIGWYKGRLTIFDIKTGSLFFKAGPAMQLAMYARSTPYDISTDTRVSDVDELRLDVGYVIHLPAGSGTCELKPVNIANGWMACQQAKAVWDIRNRPDSDWFPERDAYAEVYEMSTRATNVRECKVLWANAKDMGLLDAALKASLTARAKELAS